MKKTFFLLLAAMLLAGCQNQPHGAVPGPDNSFSAYFRDIPFDMEEFGAPRFPDTSVNIINIGAIGDGLADNTEVINKAIRELSSRGGGTVVVPAGIWKTGPIRLLDNICLHVEANALILFDPDPKRYPIIETSFEGMNTRRSTSPVWARNAKNIAVTGKGVIDGSGDAWRLVKKSKLTESHWRSLVASGGVVNDRGDIWYPSEESLRGQRVSDNFNNPQNLTTDAEWEAIHHWLRPVLVSLIKCENILLEGVTFRNSPAWCIHPLSCENFIMSDVKVFNPWYSQNGDGLDLESCKNALIVNNLFDVGDDAICLKSGKDKDGRDRNEPCQQVIIKNNVVLHGHGGFVVGSEMSGGIKDIYVADCSFLGTDVGLRFKSTRGRGGVVENIRIENIYMTNIPTEPLLFDLFYSGKSAVEDLEEGRSESAGFPEVTEETPSFRNISIRNVTCKGARRAMFFNGLPEMRIMDIYVENVIISSKFGAELLQTDRVTLKNVQIYPEQGPAITLTNSNHLSIDGKELPEIKGEPYLIEN